MRGGCLGTFKIFAPECPKGFFGICTHDGARVIRYFTWLCLGIRFVARSEFLIVRSLKIQKSEDENRIAVVEKRWDDPGTF